MIQYHWTTEEEAASIGSSSSVPMRLLRAPRGGALSDHDVLAVRGIAD